MGEGIPREPLIHVGYHKTGSTFLQRDVFTSEQADPRGPGRDIPPGFDAVLSGHIHRSQILVCDLRGRPLAAPPPSRFG